MGERRTVLVAGAGIGGLTTALALAARGFPVVVVERSAALSEIGAGIQLAPNAGRVLAGLGLDDAIAGAAIEPAAIDVIDARTGRPLASVPTARFRERYGFPYRVLHRADLQRILIAAANNVGVRLELGTTVDSFAAQPDTVLAHLRKSSGSDVVSAGALIGADGVWSSLREKIPGAAKPRPTGRTAWRALIPADIAGDVVAIDRVGLWLGARAHLVHYPVAQGAALNVVAIVEEAWHRQGWSAAGDAKDLFVHFRGWAPAILGMLEAPAAWQKYSLAVVDPSRKWLDDRLVLLGDAAHAMPPFLAQGAAMAIEDAAVLAAALDQGTDVAAGLRTYVAKRQPRAVAAAAASRRAGQRFHMRGAMAAVRNFALQLAGERLILGGSDAIYRWRPETAAR